MKSKIIYKNEEFQLTEDFIDIGYMAENIEVFDFYHKTKIIKRSNPNKSMTILLSFPNVNDEFVEEIIVIDKFLNNIQVDVNCYLIFDSHCEQKTFLKNRLTKFEIVYDKEEDFANMYGTKIIDGSLNGKLTKSLFLISKDGAIFYLDMPENLDTKINLEKLTVELNRAYLAYTGVGCH